ncbi:MAG: response regulator [Hylemonella sp.]|jgi:two-component system nitrate/nitrite response regulator NarL
MDAVRIFLVDDHSLCRSGLTELLEGRGGMKVVGATGQPELVLPMLRREQADLLVLDLRLAQTDGLSLLRQLRVEGCDIPVVILTMSAEEDDLAAALRAGVKGYLLKDMEPEAVIESIGRAARGELVVAPAMAAKLAQMWQSGQNRQNRQSGPDMPNGQKGTSKRDLVAILTEREREVLEQVAQGKSNKAIAQVLDISHNTVKLHVRHIMAKLGLNSRVEAAVFAFEHRSSVESSDSVG